MWEPYRRQLIAGHQFYVEQAEKRLLSQFQNLEEEADKYAEEWLEKAGQNFDPDRHNPEDFYEQANDESIEFYQKLEDMQNRTRLGVIAGIFHEWEKELRNWIVKEVQHWHRGDKVKKKVWLGNFSEIIDLLEAFEWPIRTREYFVSLDRCRLVVNAYKHGNEGAFSDIKSKHPEFIYHSDSSFIEYADYKDLIVGDAHIKEFSDAIVSFWKDVPEYIWEKETISVPDWFGRAYQKDKNTDTKSKVAKS